MNVAIRHRWSRCTVPIRYYSLAVAKARGKYESCDDYLKYCKENNINVLSTVFKGTLYELTTKAFLEKELNCKELALIGGAFDNGVDILGKWDLSKFRENAAQGLDPATKAGRRSGSLLYGTEEISELAREKSSKSLLSLASDINLYVQCKHHNNKLGVSLIRELVGSYQGRITSKSDLHKHYMFLISTHNLTKQAQHLLDSSSIPFIHCKLQGMVYNGIDDFYNIKSWNGGILESIYFNPVARKFLKGLKIELQLELIKKQSQLTVNLS